MTPLDAWFRVAGMEAVAVPARDVEAMEGRRVRFAPHADRQRQDARRVRWTVARRTRRSTRHPAQEERNAPAAPALDHAAARVGDRHAARPARTGRCPRAGLAHRPAYRRCERARSTPGARGPARCARDHARIAVAAALVSGIGGAVLALAHHRGRRVARIARQQARRAAATCFGARAYAGARVATLGSVRDARQSGRSARRPAAACPRCRTRLGPAAARADAGYLVARSGRAFPVGRSSRSRATRARGRSPAVDGHEPAVHQHAFAGRTVASRVVRGVAGRPGHAVVAPRVHRREVAPGGGDRVARRHGALRGCHVESRPRRRLPRRRSSVPARQPEGHGAPAATRGPRAPSARRTGARGVRAHACAGNARVRRRAASACAWAHRTAVAAAFVARRPRAALRDAGARRRLRRRGLVRRSARHARLRRARSRDLAGGAGVHRAGRIGAVALSRLSARGRRCRRSLRGRGSQGRVSASPVDRHDHQRRQRGGEVPARRRARLGRGKFHLAAAARRSLPVRGPHARTGAHARNDGAGAPGQAQRRHGAEMARRALAVVGRTRARGRARARGRCVGRNRCAGTARVAAAAHAAAHLVGPARPGSSAVRMGEDARWPPSVRLSLRRSRGARRPGRADRLALGTARAQLVFVRGERLRLRVVGAGGSRCRGGDCSRRC